MTDSSDGGACLRRSEKEYLKPLMSTRQRVEFWLIALFWLGSLMNFWWWWFQPEHWVEPVGMLIFSCLFILGYSYQSALFGCVSARIPRRDLEIPENLRVAMIVTKAPSEPWPLVRNTLEGMLEQDYPKPYDVWLADERVSEEVRQWCDANGVRISTREGVVEYNRSAWPRRTRCKEGNLAFFYDHYGYESYDIVCQFDADHAPDRNYLREVVPCFLDPSVGYVAAPSINTRGSDRSWIARGRVDRESIFHGVAQAGSFKGKTAVCIGSHYAIRTSALREIGGLGPFLVEDFTTTVILNSHGWNGVFARQAIAIGSGPESFADAMTQERQWAYGLTHFILGPGRKFFRTMALPKRFSLIRKGSCYLVLSALMTGTFVFPLVALGMDIPWLRIPLLDLALYASLPASAISLLLRWIRLNGWSRPLDAKQLSWENFFYEYTRWPWVTLGVLQALVDSFTGRTVSGYQVTPKGRRNARLPSVYIAPPLLLTLVSVLGILIYQDAVNSAGYLLLVAASGGLTAVSGMLIVHMHLRENALQLNSSWPQVIAVWTAAWAMGQAVRTVLDKLAAEQDFLWMSEAVYSPTLLVVAFLAVLVNLGLSRSDRWNRLQSGAHDHVTEDSLKRT